MPGVQRLPFGSHGNLLICISSGDLMSHSLWLVLKLQEPNLSRLRKAGFAPKEDKRMGPPGLIAAVCAGAMGKLSLLHKKTLAGLSDDMSLQELRSHTQRSQNKIKTREKWPLPVRSNNVIGAGQLPKGGNHLIYTICQERSRQYMGSGMLKKQSPSRGLKPECLSTTRYSQIPTMRRPA